MPKIPKTIELFDFSKTQAEKLLIESVYPFEAITKIRETIEEISEKLDDSYEERTPGIFIAEDAQIWEGATICPPCIIGHKTEVRPGAFIRGNVIIGDNAVIGNSTEIKNSIILDGAQLPHYNYVGDSIIGHKAHLGAGVIASNLRLDKQNVFIKCGNEQMPTGLRKVGAFVGDFAEIGCGSVLCPGTILGRSTKIYPLTSVSGIIFEKNKAVGEVCE